MFHISYTEKADCKGKITVEKLPCSIGPIVDVNGNRWDIRGIYYSGTKKYVSAVPMAELHPYYYDTSINNYGGELISQRWDPYEIEEVNNV